MRKSWDRITGIGIASSTAESDIKHIRLLNIIIIMTASMNLGFVPMLVISLPDTAPVLCSLVILNAIYLLALWFNHRGWHLMARLHFGVFGIINVSVNSTPPREPDHFQPKYSMAAALPSLLSPSRAAPLQRLLEDRSKGSCHSASPIL